MPLVSIISPAYNSAATIRRCHESVCSQTLQDWEHIVIVDGGNDETANVLAQLAQKEPRLKVIYKQANEGAAKARNSGIEAAQGRFITFIDADDEWLPEKLETQINFMVTEQVPFSYGSYYLTNSCSHRVQRVYNPPLKLDHDLLLRSCPVGCLTAAYDRDFYGTQYMPNVRRGQDWGLWLKLTRLNPKPAKKYPGVHAIYHRTQGSISSQKLRKLRDVWKIYRKHEKVSPLSSAFYVTLLAIASFAKK